MYEFRFRRGSAAQWTSINPVLRPGEPGYETDTGKLKIGNGIKAWIDLSYLSGEGTPGAPGKSAYQVAVDNGFTGTEAQWLLSLVGPKGNDGINGIDGIDGTDGTNGSDGASAYQVAVSNGFVGTQADWLLSLVGPQGDAGPPGSAGGDSYPLSEYGFFTASSSLESFMTNSTIGNFWVNRIFIPAGKVITKVGLHVISAASAPSGVDQLVVYDDAGNLIGETLEDATIWGAPNQNTRARNLITPIPAESADRFVYAGWFAAAPSGAQTAYNVTPAGMIKGPTGSRRRSIFDSFAADRPASFDPATYGTTSDSYLPFIAIG